MPKAAKKKASDFNTAPVKSVFLYGDPNKEKLDILIRMEKVFCDLVNKDIKKLSSTNEIMLYLIKNDKKASEMRRLEKTMRPNDLSSAFCQAAFDMAVTHLSNRLDQIRLDLYSDEKTIFAQSKVLFAMALMRKPREEMILTMRSISKSEDDFYAKCATELSRMGDDVFGWKMQDFADLYTMKSLEYQIPSLSRADIPLDSRLMKVEKSYDIEAPYVITITDPFQRGKRFAVPLNTSKHSLHKIASNQMAKTVIVSVKNGQLRVGWSYEKHLERPKTSEVIGVDTGIKDLFHTSEGKAVSSMQPVIDFYHDEVEPAFAEMSKLLNKKRAISHYLRRHKSIPDDVRRSLIEKMDRLDYMIKTMDAPYRKKRRYYASLDKAVKDGVTEYVSSINKETLTVIERLDIKEFKKSRRVNGMMSVFARGKAQKALMTALNWKGFDFVEVEPDYTSQVCPKCYNLDADNRNGKVFKCTCCGFTDDADHVGAVNIKERILDPDLKKLCDDHKNRHKALQDAIRIYYHGRHQNYQTQNPCEDQTERELLTA